MSTSHTDRERPTVAALFAHLDGCQACTRVLLAWTLGNMTPDLCAEGLRHWRAAELLDGAEQ